MATEAPLFHDGAQTTAAANYYNPATPLYGPGGSGQFLVVYLSAARVVTVATVATQIPYGVLQNTPMATEAADVGIFGITKFVCGPASIAAGVPLMVYATAPGTVMLWTASGTNFKVGMSLEASVQGQVFTGMVLPYYDAGAA
jgi:hypothetical protein